VGIRSKQLGGIGEGAVRVFLETAPSFHFPKTPAAKAIKVRKLIQKLASKFARAKEPRLATRIMGQLTDTEFIDFCYRFILGRKAHEGELQKYLDDISRGDSRLKVIGGFLDSGEFEKRLRHCYQYEHFEHFGPSGHFNSPIPDFSSIENSYEKSKLSDFGREISLDDQLAFVQTLKPFYDECPLPESKTAQFRYFFNNGSFNHFDGMMLYCMIRQFKPNSIIEIGSGYSSALMADVNEQVLNYGMNLTFIDPYSEVLRALFGNDQSHKAEIIPERVQDLPVEFFDKLKLNDILFIDSSHVSKFGSDVNCLIFNILPRIESGVIVHIHDIFDNFDYPIEWLKEGRAWNEAYLVRAFLSYNKDFRVLLFNDHFASHHWDYLLKEMPKCTLQPKDSPFRNSGQSLWLVKQ
jgi:predicted O-methyltransferase YrrM